MKPVIKHTVNAWGEITKTNITNPTIDVFYGNEPVIEVKFDAQQNAHYGLHRDRVPDRDWPELRWTRIDNNDKYKSVKLTDELKIILLEDLAFTYGKTNELRGKLIEFNLI